MTDDRIDLETLRFPIGRFNIPDTRLSEETRSAMIDRIASTPDRLRAAVDDLDRTQLETPYRSDGWTVRQVVHHVADSHMNSYVRFKLTVTEDHPTIGTYDEAAWGEEPDARGADIELSLTILSGLHARWTEWLAGLPDAAWSRTLHHPEMGKMVLDQLLAMYAWHGDHHIAHISELRSRQGW